MSDDATTGAIACVLLLGSALYGMRKWSWHRGIGALRIWMIGHLVISTVFLGAVAVHLGSSRLSHAGLVLLGLVLAETGSGLWGAIELVLTPRRFARFAKHDFMFPSTVRRRIAVATEAIERALVRRNDAFHRWFDATFGAVLDGRAREAPPCTGFPPLCERAAEEVHEHVVEIARLRVLLGDLEKVERRSERWLDVHVPVATALAILVSAHALGWL